MGSKINKSKEQTPLQDQKARIAKVDSVGAFTVWCHFWYSMTGLAVSLICVLFGVILSFYQPAIKLDWAVNIFVVEATFTQGTTGSLLIVTGMIVALVTNFGRSKNSV
ncbi:hypothetical protein FLL83_19345 [Vibrio cholerae]|uniref:hypothetical protein n=1 Tax=Vibrio cholerae TaxID=666 RepID=UPI00115B9FA2|nr:hypothetical protein [Vibrio cholerae]TQP19556.1 hypothetical protein FLM04_15710 [Vibrio cholerae]TQP71761.1 hypothetical protein FLL75_16080 [Vibrio cholerae]TQP88715.1 hypothetical protein FLL87_15275 [Vibrio cholerae]TQQ57588.1 hypothetical protein FLL83_19345 [Vibrio cholerae]GIA35791.1 hypothetical protein VCSRO85_3449 [Vibrio cholerae]